MKKYSSFLFLAVSIAISLEGLRQAIKIGDTFLGVISVIAWLYAAIITIQYHYAQENLSMEVRRLRSRRRKTRFRFTE